MVLWLEIANFWKWNYFRLAAPIHNIGAIHKWRHSLRGEGGSVKRWCYSINVFSKMSDKGEGGVKNFKNGWRHLWTASKRVSPQAARSQIKIWLIDLICWLWNQFMIITPPKFGVCAGWKVLAKRWKICHIFI